MNIAGFQPLSLGVHSNVGSHNAYMNTVLRLPMLSYEEEQHLTSLIKETKDPAAIQTVVNAHLKLVVTIARSYRGYGFPLEDLIQEGNIGLMKAIERFDNTQNYRFSSYATQWVKAEISAFVMNNFRMMKIVTTKPMRKLFFKLRSMSGHKYLTLAEMEDIAAKLDVPVRDVKEMEQRLRGDEYSMDLMMYDPDDREYQISTPALMDFTEPADVMASATNQYIYSVGIEDALKTLDARSRNIVEERWLKHDDGSQTRLQDLADEYGVSTQRIAQIEKEALKKMKAALSKYSEDVQYS